MIWLQCLPKTATIEFNEAEFDVTNISPQTPFLFTSKEAQATALSSLSFTQFPIWGPEDWENLSLDAQKMILQIIIHPSKSPSLSVTWADIWSVLGDALLAIKQLHLVCRQTERLVRLFMLEEAEWLGVGQACNEDGLFTNGESVSGERKTRESLQAQLTVTMSKYTVDEFEEQTLRDEVTVWKLVDEKVDVTFEPKANHSSTKAFSRVEVESTSRTSLWQLHSAAKSPKMSAQVVGEEEEEEEEEEAMGEEVEKSEVELTEEAVAKYLEECARLWAPEPKDPSWDEEGSISYPDNGAVMGWLG